MKTFQKIMGKIVNLLIILVIIAIIFCLYFIISIKVFHKKYINFFGYSIFEVATGSMHGSIEIGDAVLVKINSDYDQKYSVRNCILLFFTAAFIGYLWEVLIIL